MSLNSTYANFSRLSLKDLIAARNLFHAHLINKRNVVATAIGRYLIRITDIDDQGNIIPSNPKVTKDPRTLENSVVIPSSWPCILVFVNEWEKQEALLNPDTTEIVPKTIYMPDGTMVPVCVVLASKNTVGDDDIDLDELMFPTNMVGGGFPLIVEAQKQEHVATIGCIVTNGHTYYVLSNRHVVGEKGQLVSTRLGKATIPIGISSGDSIGKVDFSKLYPGWSTQDMKVCCDVGLIEIADLNIWKTDIMGIKSIDEMYDLNTLNLDLGIISEHKVIQKMVQTSENGKVIGYGARSGLMKGEIKALFYRYKAVGGIEFVSDFLISGRYGRDLGVSHADSGTLWLLENKDKLGKDILQPIALHWGQHEFFDANQKDQFTYSLSTCLSNICRELDVEIVRGWNIEEDYSWGKVGHYTVGNLSVSAVKSVKLKKLMKANLTNISFEIGDINKALDAKKNPALPTDPTVGFCPLADVPDIIWKQFKLSADKKTGTKWGRKGDENPNHFADADEKTITGDTLFTLCTKAKDLTTKVWNKYYDDLDAKDGRNKADKKLRAGRGLVCFRVWQIFDYMVKAVKTNKPDQFIFGAGVLAHYVGDACQPLHGSYMHDGDPADSKEVDYTAKRTSKKRNGEISHKAGDVYKKTINPGQGVHVAYEDTMIDNFIDKILPKVRAILAGNTTGIFQVPQMSDGQEAGFAVLQLMQATQTDLPPKSIIDTFIKAKEDKLDVSKELYDAHHEATETLLARGSLYLAAIWDAAWAVGKGNTKVTNLAKVDTHDLIKLYADPTKLPSRHLDTVDTVL